MNRVFFLFLLLKIKNLCCTEYEVDYDQRIDQLIFEKYEAEKFVEVESDEMFTETDRDSNGFGSSSK